MSGVPGVRPVRPRAETVAVYHLYVIEVAPEHRDPLRDWLDRHGIDTGIHCPIVCRYAWPSELDLMARLAGLRLKERWASWGRAPFIAASRTHVSVYAR